MKPILESRDKKKREALRVLIGKLVEFYISERLGEGMLNTKITRNLFSRCFLSKEASDAMAQAVEVRVEKKEFFFFIIQ